MRAFCRNLRLRTKLVLAVAAVFVLATGGATLLAPLQRPILLVAVAGALAAIALLLILSASFTRPLDELVAAMRALEHGDLTYPLAAPGRDEAGEVTAAFDRMRQALQVAQQRMLHTARIEAVAHLAGGVAHDFNNLLTVINGYSELLLERADPTDPNRKGIEQIAAAGSRAAALTRQLLAFSRTDVAHPQRLDLNEIIGRMDRMLSVVVGGAVAIDYDLAADLPPIHVDAAQMEQVLVNLAANARDAMPGGGRLGIATRVVEVQKGAATVVELPAGRYVKLQVVDNGLGMDAQTQRHLFEPFFTTKEVGKGTGLGLAAIHGIIKQSHGHISVHSQPGQGARFDIYLPAPETPPPARDRPAAAPGTSAVRETVLLVEEEHSRRDLVRQLLTQHGYRVIAAANGAEALDRIEDLAAPVDLIFTDVARPGAGGRELIERLGRRWPSVKVVYTSGDPATTGCGVATAQFLAQPFTPAALVRTIHESLRGVPAPVRSDA